MIHQFKKGDKVTVREGATSIGGHKTDPKEVRTVRTVWSGGRVGLTPVRTGAPGNVFEPEDLVPYVKAPVLMHPAAVKPGDTVRLERDGGRLPDQEVVVVTATEQGWIILILKGAVEVRVTGPDPWLITDHTPAPEPVDERIAAWERVARHPALSSAYDGEGPLIDSVMAVLDQISREPQPAPEPEPVYEPRKVYEHPNGDRFWSVNTEHGVMLVNEYGDTDHPADITQPLRPLVVIDPEEDVDRLSNIIREVDGNHDLGAGALAEAILERLAK